MTNPDKKGLGPTSHLEIDLSAIRGNFDEIRRRAGPGRKIIAVVKADAYGHGAVASATALADRADYFAAGSVEEALAVKQVTTAPVIVLGSLDPADCAAVLEHELLPSLDDLSSATALSRAAGNRIAEVFVKVDCGFGRFGVGMPEAAEFTLAIAALPGLKLGGIYTHLPFSDEASRVWAEEQGRAFRALVASIEKTGLRVPLVQQLASPGLVTALPARDEAVAAGQLLYGMQAVGNDLSPDMAGFRPALRSIVTRLVHIGERLPGMAAAPFLRETEGRLGVIPVGISHGYRPISRDAFVMVDGARARVLRPCLQNTILDLSTVPAARIGAKAMILGGMGRHAVTLADLADWQRTSELAMLTSLSKSLPHNYLGV